MKRIKLLILILLLLGGCGSAHKNMKPDTPAIVFSKDTREANQVNCPVNKYFFPTGVTRIKYDALFTFAGESFPNHVYLDVENVLESEKGALYKIEINCDKDLVPEDFKEWDRFKLGYFYVDGEKIYLIRDFDLSKNPLSLEDVLKTATVICQNEARKDPLEKDEKGLHESILIDGNKCEYHAYNSLTETGFYESFVWEKGKGLVAYRSGFGAEKDAIELLLDNADDNVSAPKQEMGGELETVQKHSIQSEIESLYSTAPFVAKYCVEESNLITYGHLWGNEFLYNMNDDSGIINEVIYSITEQKDQQQFAYNADIDNDGENEMVVLQRYKGKDNLTLLTNRKDKYVKKYNKSYTIDIDNQLYYDALYRIIEFDGKQYLALSYYSVDRDGLLSRFGAGLDGLLRYDRLILYSIHDGELIADNYELGFEDTIVTRFDSNTHKAWFRANYHEAELELRTYDNVAELIAQNHMEEAKELYERDHKQNPGEASNESFFRKYYPFTKEPIYGYQCDIDGDGEDERILFRTGADPDGGTDIFIEKLNANGQYVLVYAYDRLTNDVNSMYPWFSGDKNTKSVIKLKEKYYIVGYFSEGWVDLHRFDKDENQLGKEAFIYYSDDNVGDP